MRRLLGHLRYGVIVVASFVAFVVLLVGIALYTGGQQTADSRAGGEQEAIRHTAAGTCGVERWAVKTLTDGVAVNLRPRLTTVRALGALVPPPLGQDSPRFPAERRTYTVRATLTFIRQEADSDKHLGLASYGHHMIAEAPAPFCDSASPQAVRLGVARSRVDTSSCVGKVVTVTGVRFFDIPHGQSSIAPNAVELHPVLGYGCTP